MKQIVFGTGNPGKLIDIRPILAHRGLAVKTLADLGIKMPEIDESGDTFEANAVIKYKALRPLVPDEYILVTDDTGIMIEALDGEPGVHTRRWNPEKREMSDEEILDKTLRLLKGRTDRTAKFVCVIAFGTSDQPNLVKGDITGELLTEPDAAGFLAGLPFRALFYVPAAGKMLYELHDIPLSQRQGVYTHRENAWLKLLDRLSDD